jgi:hypothetical protein
MASSPPYNPAGPQTPAGNTMSYPRGQSGGRTRNVVNINNPGSEGTATFSWAGGASGDGSPNAASAPALEGFDNFRRQRYLHLLIKNNATGGNFKCRIWLYNTAFGSWGQLNFIKPSDATGGLPVELTVANNDDEYFIFDIAGAERIYIQQLTIDSAGTAEAYCGVNSF